MKITTEVAQDMIEAALAQIVLRHDDFLMERLRGTGYRKGDTLPPFARRCGEVRDDFESLLGMVQNGIIEIVDHRVDSDE